MEETAERKLVTIVFADLVGSTALAGGEDPERTRILLERFYEAMTEEIALVGGTVEKFAGDAVMAVFGAPAAHEDDAERALHAALAMRRRLEELSGDGLALRIGVNTGEVLVGRAREGSSFASGDAVNVAARLEQAAAPGEILVGERTAAAARGAFEFDEPAPVEAKGKPEGVPARRLVRALTLMRPRGVAGLQSVFVGRDAELTALQDAYERAAGEGRPQLVTILGDPGVGKTRLVREFWQWLSERSPEPVRRTGRCLSYGQAATYWPLGEVLKEHLGLLESDPPELILRRLGERPILGLTLGLDTGGDLHPLAARDRLHAAWVEFCGKLARTRPAVLFIEDLHWAEPPLLDLLERLAEDVQGGLLLLTTARPELLDSRPGWGRRAAGTLLELEPLSSGDAGRLLDELLAAELPERLKAIIVRKAEGNPFFVEEILATLVDRGVIERVDSGWTAHEIPPGFDVPDTVRSVLAARIDLLDAAEKAALQAAAVIGRIFWSGPLYELLPGLEPDLRVLEERDFVRRRTGSSIAGEQEYAIKHALTGEVAYQGLTKAARARLHAGFARWLEGGGPEREQHAALIAHHYREAVRGEDADLAWAEGREELARLRGRARHWLRRAAELSFGRYELDDGIELLEGALELEPQEGEQAELWRSIGHAQALKYDGEAFWTAMERSLEVCHDRETCAESYSELVFQTSIRSGMWPERPEASLFDGWLERALELTEPGTPARARALIAQANFHPDEGDDAAREAGDLADRLGEPDLRSWAHAASAEVAFQAKRYEEALAHVRKRFDLEEEISDPDHLVEIRESAVPALLALGRLDEARRMADEHVELSRRLSSHHRLHAIALLTEIEEVAAEWEKIRAREEALEAAVAVNRETPCVRNARVLLTCALARLHEGDESRAEELERAADGLGMTGHGLALDSVRLRIALVRGRLDEVERMLRSEGRIRNVFGVQALAARLDGLAALGDREGVEQDAPPFLGSRTYLEPFALRALGRVREDDDLLVEAAGRFDQLGLDRHALETRALL